MVHLYSSTDTATILKKSCLISSERSDFHMICICVCVCVCVCVMNSPVNLDVYGLNISGVNHWVTYKDNLFIVMKACLDPGTLKNGTNRMYSNLSNFKTEDQLCCIPVQSSIDFWFLNCSNHSIYVIKDDNRIKYVDQGINYVVNMWRKMNAFFIIKLWTYWFTKIMYECKDESMSAVLKELLVEFTELKYFISYWMCFRLLYNCGGIFFMLSFFVLYILSFCLVRLRTFRLMHGLVRCTHWVQVFTCARGVCDNQRCHNKNPR